MFSSLFQIDFIDTNGGSTRLLSYGDYLEKPLEVPWSQSADGYTPIGAIWGKSRAKGGGRRTLEWARRATHATHAEVAAYVLRYPASLPTYREGKFRISIQGGEVWDFMDSVFLGAVTRPMVTSKCHSITTFRGEAGQMLPVSGLAYYAGVPHSWNLVTHSAQTRTHSNM